ncbi:hypothetical protein AYJ08_14370 [Brevibacillus sp. SKDU10]|nr:hypothetical protein AYJ08_14370 [Brevibacillus sp. SKDU10]
MPPSKTDRFKKVWFYIQLVIAVFVTIYLFVHLDDEDTGKTYIAMLILLGLNALALLLKRQFFLFAIYLCLILYSNKKWLSAILFG